MTDDIDPYERFEPDPVWGIISVSKPCKCGLYQTADGVLQFYCSWEHFYDG